MAQTLTHIQKLEKYTQSYGEDKMIEMTLSKLFDYKIQIYNKHIKELITEMQEYEQKYNMKSKDFYQSFNAGKMGDAMDFVDWASLYQMWESIVARKRVLEG